MSLDGRRNEMIGTGALEYCKSNKSGTRAVPGFIVHPDDVDPEPSTRSSGTRPALLASASHAILAILGDLCGAMDQGPDQMPVIALFSASKRVAAVCVSPSYSISWMPLAFNLRAVLELEHVGRIY